MSSMKKNETSPNIISVGSIFSTAWGKLPGAKAPIWSIAITFVLLGALIEWMSLHYINTENETLLYTLRHILIPILTNLCIAPFYAGSFMVAIRHVCSKPINMRSGYRYFNQYVAIATAMVIIGILSNLVVMVVNFPTLANYFGSKEPYLELFAGIYSLFVYALFVFTLPLIIDQRYKITKALLASVKLAKPHLLKIVVIFVLAYLCIFLATIPALIALSIGKWAVLRLLGSLFFIIALIWLLPFFFLLCAELYHRIVLTRSSS